MNETLKSKRILEKGKILMSISSFNNLDECMRAAILREVASFRYLHVSHACRDFLLFLKSMNIQLKNNTLHIREDYRIEYIIKQFNDIFGEF